MGNSNASGLASSIVMSASKGIELYNPSYVEKVTSGQKGTDT